MRAGEIRAGRPRPYIPRVYLPRAELVLTQRGDVRIVIHYYGRTERGLKFIPQRKIFPARDMVRQDDASASGIHRPSEADADCGGNAAIQEPPGERKHRIVFVLRIFGRW